MQTIPSEKRPEFLLEARIPPSPQIDPERRKKRLLLALTVLLVALVAVILKNWDFWFPPASEPESAVAEQSTPRVARSKVTTARQSAGAGSARDRKPSQANVQESAAMSVTSERAALPDLQVEVVAGNQRRTVTAHSNTFYVDLASSASAPPAQSAPQQKAMNSGNQVQISPQAAETVSRPVAPDYPLLARQMKVQGAVVLQALISREGNIEELHIVSGPDILAAAAREAVRQWHFRPFYQNGRPVQTQARVTVNFTISTN